MCNVTNVSGLQNGSWSPLGISKPQLQLRERPGRLVKRLAFQNGYDFFKADATTVRHLLPKLDGVYSSTYFYSPCAAHKIFRELGELPLDADGKMPDVWEHFPPVSSIYAGLHACIAIYCGACYAQSAGEATVSELEKQICAEATAARLSYMQRQRDPAVLAKAGDTSFEKQ